MRRRWPVVLLAAIAALLGASLIAALLSGRQIQGSVPVDAPALALAAIDEGRMVATTAGVFITRNDIDWAAARQFGSGSALVASRDGVAAIRFSDGKVRRTMTTRDLDEISGVTDEDPLGAAMSFAPDGSLHLVDSRAEAIIRVGGSDMHLPAGGPGAANALAVASDRFLLGGVTTGLWELRGQSWLRLVATPVRAVLIDEKNESRIFLGSPGGLLVSRNAGRSWRFTSLREPIEGIAQDSSRYYAITNRKIIYRSGTGEEDWEAPAL